jgi:hypothetical protein
LDIYYRLPGTEACDKQDIEVLFKAELLEVGGDVCHLSVELRIHAKLWLRRVIFDRLV